MKNKKRFIGVLICIALITIVFIAGYTFARYYKTVNVGKTQGTIARWSFGSKNVNETISLSEGKLAPGTNGSFEIEVDATDSEVPVEYYIQVDNENNIPTNMTFSAKIEDQKGNITSTDPKSSFTELATESLKGNIPVSSGNQKRTIVVYWDWPFNENDTTTTDSDDATLQAGENASALNCGFNIQIVGKQAKQ